MDAPTTGAREILSWTTFSATKNTPVTHFMNVRPFADIRASTMGFLKLFLRDLSPVVMQDVIAENPDVIVCSPRSRFGNHTIIYDIFWYGRR